MRGAGEEGKVEVLVNSKAARQFDEYINFTSIVIIFFLGL
jgi:hypothetical protein